MSHQEAWLALSKDGPRTVASAGASHTRRMNSSPAVLPIPARHAQREPGTVAGEQPIQDLDLLSTAS
jgi:hypothetical protein